MNNILKLLSSSKTTKVFGKLSQLSKLVIIGLMVVIYFYLSIISMVQTVRLGGIDGQEELSYNYDNVVVNLVVLLFVLLVIVLMYPNILEKMNSKDWTIRLCIYVLILGGVWIFLADTVAIGDSNMCFSTGRLFAKGDYSSLQSDIVDFKHFESSYNYFQYFPFQLGYTLVCQIVNTIFGDSLYKFALQFLNLFSLMAIFLGLIKISHDIFSSKKVLNLTIILCFGFLSGLIFTTYIYGNLLGFALATWAISLTIRYVQTNKRYLMVVTAVLLGLSITVKLNNIIVLIAICIVLAIKFLDTRKLYDLVSIVLCALLGLNLINVVISGYESKAGVELGSGMPKIIWLNIGLHESDSACGWYDSKRSVDLYDSCNGDNELTIEKAIGQIEDQLETFAIDNTYTMRFFSEKVLSQWNEPTYDSVWINKTRLSYQELPELLTNKINLWNRFESYMNQYQQVLYIGAFIGLVLLCKKRDISFYLVPLVVLGGFMYHLLFEAKSQYVITYVMLLIPICAYGLEYILSIDVLTKLKGIFLSGEKDI